jgi:hypothetical protein
MDASGAISLHKKGEQPKTGPRYGSWENKPEIAYGSMPGGQMLAFDLNQLTLNDFDAMRYHPQINASLSVLTFMIHQADWRIECEDAKIREMVEENVRVIWTRLVRGMAQAFWAGFSPCVLEYENDPQGRHVIINKVKDLSPHECAVHWKKITQNVDGRERHSYVYDGIDQHGWGTIPAMNTLWYPALMENGNHTGRKLLKSAFMPWYFSQLMHIYTNRYFERFGEPLPIGRAPFETEIVEPDGTRRSGKQVMEDVIAGIRSRASVVLPSDKNGDVNVGSSAYDYDVEYLESTLRGVDFERYLIRLDEEMSLALFTPLLLLRNADVGSHNLGVQHTQTWLWMINAITGDMKEYIDRYICERLKAINFSPNAARCEWVPRKMGKESVETTRAIITELIRSDKAGVDLEELGTHLGMTVKQVRQVVEDNADANADDTNADAPDQDTRQRTERDRSNASTRTVGRDRVPGTRTVTARVRSQAALSWESGAINIDRLNKFERSALHHLADPIDTIIGVLNGLPVEEFDTVDDLMAVFNGSLDSVEHRAS